MEIPIQTDKIMAGIFKKDSSPLGMIGISIGIDKFSTLIIIMF